MQPGQGWLGSIWSNLPLRAAQCPGMSKKAQGVRSNSTFLNLGQLRTGRSPTVEKLPLYRRVDIKAWTDSLPQVTTSSQKQSIKYLKEQNFSQAWDSALDMSMLLQPQRQLLLRLGHCPPRCQCAAVRWGVGENNFITSP